VVVVNSKTAAADGIFKIPIIGDLAKYVCFDKALQNAIINDYAKEVDLMEVNNGYALGLPYVIADSKRMVVFFQIPENATQNENDFIHIFIKKIVNTDTGEEFEGYSSNSISFIDSGLMETEGLGYSSIRTIDMTIPQNMKIYVTMKRENFSINNENQEFQPSDIFEPAPNTQIETLGDFVFELHLDDFAEPKVTTLDKDIVVKGQTIHINTIVESPTGTEISVNFPDTNDSIINGLDFRGIDTNGDEWGNPGGVISSGPDKDGRILYYLEGNYSSSIPLDKIQITGIRLIKKSEAEITIDLEKMTITPELSETHIKSITKAGDKAYITFQTKAFDCFEIFNHEYLDTEGNKYYFNSEGVLQQGDKVENNFAVVWPKDNKVILTRSLSPMINLENPVEIELVD
jgi:hypothetical protein